MKTEAWLSYDESFLYVAVRCYEPLLRDVLSDTVERDGNLRDEDSIEILFDANHDKKTFQHFGVN